MDLCSLNNLNQGLPDCDLKIGVPDYFIASPHDAVIGLAQLASPFKYLREMTMAPDPLKRFYAIPRDIKRIADSSSEAPKGSLDKGYEEKLGDGRFIYTFEWPSRMVADRNIYKFDGYEGGGFIVNEQGILFGLRNSNGSMSPFQCKIDIDGGGFSASGGDAKTVIMKIDIGKKSAIVRGLMPVMLAATDRMETLRGYRDLEIVVLDVSSLGVATVQLVTSGDNMNIFGRFSDGGADKFESPSNWRVDGAEASAVAVDATQKAYKVTVGAGMHDLNIAPVDVLKTDGITGFEGIAVTVSSAA